MADVHKAPILLWPQGAPGALGDRPQDAPTITPYLADPGKACGTAIIVCPGGTYINLMPHEGEDYAHWLNKHGITAFVLKYRLGPDEYRHPAMLADISRAMRVVRERAAEWHIDPERIGVMGSSAGGHLASTLLVHFDKGNPGADELIERQSSRPDFGILCYAVTMLNARTHEGLKLNLLGENPSPEALEFLSTGAHVRDDTPPCFIWHTREDAVVPPEHSLNFASALAARQVPFDLHIYEKGRHGIGLGKSSLAPEELHPWTGELLYWLNERGLLNR